MNKKSIIITGLILFFFVTSTASATFTLYNTLTFGGMADITGVDEFTLYTTLTFGGFLSATGTSSQPDTPPVIENNSHANQSYENSIAFTYEVDFWDSEGVFDWWMNCSDTSTDSGSGNGTGSIVLSGLSYFTKYWVNCTADDTNNVTYVSYWFVTLNQTTVEPPNSLTAVSINSTKINLTWVKGTNATNTRIQHKTGGYPETISDGTNVYNSTGTSESDTSLNPGTKYYYRAWSWNSTLNNWSTSNITTYQYTYPGVPTDFVVTTVNSTKITLTWVKGAGAENTYISYNISDYPINYADGISTYTGTGTTTDVTGLTNSTQYYFRAWGYDSGSGNMSLTNVSGTNTTDATPSVFTLYGTLTFGGFVNVVDPNPVISNVYPSNSSVSISAYPQLYITITDPNSLNIDASWSTNATGTWTHSNATVASGSTIYQRATFANTSETIYWWNMSVNNSNGDWTNESYHFTLKNYTWDTWSDWWVMDYNNLAASTNLTVSNYNYQGINLTWTKGVNSTHTYIRYKKDSAPSSRTDGTLLVNTTLSLYNHSGLDLGTHYYYSVWSYNSTDNVYGGDIVTGSNYTNPGAPISFDEVTHTSSAFFFNFSMGTNASHTIIYVNSTGNGNYPNRTNGVKKINSTGTFGQVLSLEPATTYWWSAYSYSSTSNLYSITNLTLTNHTEISPPSSPSVSNYNYQGINITWTNEKGGDYTYIRYKKDSAPSSRTDGTLLVNTTLSLYNHSGLDLGTRYYYRIYGYNITWNEYSSVAQLLNNYTNPGAPTSLQDTDSGMEQISFSWTKGTNATRSVVYVNATGVGSYPNRTNGIEKINNTITSGTATGLEINNTYYFSVYSFNPDSGLWSEGNDTDTAATVAGAGNLTGLTATRFNDVQLNITWNKGVVDDDTVVIRKTGSYPSSVTDGTEVYNDSFSSYKDTGLTPATHYYYRAWSWNGEEFGAVYSSDSEKTRPSPPQDFTGEIDSGALDITWIKGTGAVRTVIRNNTGSYPSSPTDGYEVYNNTGTTTTVSGISSIDYYTGWSFTVIDGEGVFSVSTTLVWGGLEINVYNEDNPSIEIGNYTVFITNNDASESYENTSQNNPFRIDVSDVPNGADITVQVSKDGYKTRSQVIDMYENAYYTVNFYLPPDSDGSPDEESGEDWYIPPSSDDTVLVSTTESVVNHTTDETVTLDCSPSDVEIVYLFNVSIYGGWIEVPGDKYSLSGNILTVLASALDVNSSMIKVQYYCVGDSSYSSHYIITVNDNAEQSVDNAYVTISRYMNTSDSYETVLSSYTDSSGQMEADLIPNIVYSVVITKTDYNTTTAFWSPPEISQYEDSQKTFILYPSESNYTEEVGYSDCVVFEGGYSGNTGFVNLSNDGSNDNCGSMTNYSIYIYRINTTTNATVLIASYNGTNQSTSITFDIYDLNNTFFVTAFINHNTFGGHWGSFYINPSHEDADSPYVHTDVDEFNNFFDELFGGNSLGWSAIFGIFVLLACLFSFGQRNIGVGLILTGVTLLGFNALIGLELLNGVICIVTIVFGVLVQWKISRKEG